MNNIIGTIVDVEELITKSETPISLSNDNSDEPAQHSLIESRIYNIPTYQREIRWTKENIIRLILDITSGPKFLGNVILSKKAGKQYDIIDGQQRITVIKMLLHSINIRYGPEIGVEDNHCEIKNESCRCFGKLYDNNFDVEQLSPEDLDGDDYTQVPIYTDLWKKIMSSSELDNAEKARSFRSNLNSSTFNVIINTERKDDSAIRYFLDVNLKGVKLDTEDIFKGYLFANDKSDDIRTAWVNLKKANQQLINAYSNWSTKKKIHFPLMTAIYYYFNCILFSEPKYAKYAKVKFNAKFEISEDEVPIMEKESSENENNKSQIYRKGDHLIEVLNNNALMLSSMKNICRLLNFIANIINEDKQKFKDLFKVDEGAALQASELEVIFNLIRKIILDEDVVPKLVLFKYLVCEIFGKTNKRKENIRKIYAMYTVSVFFTIFSIKKDKDKLMSIAKATDWYVKTINVIHDYLKTDTLVNPKVLNAKYKYITVNEDMNGTYSTVDATYRCKSLATIYNYFSITPSKISLNKGAITELKNFLINEKDYTTEHLIINKSNNVIISKDDEIEYKYPKQIAALKDSLFNFIFIPNEINEKLGNMNFDYKIAELKKHTLTCPRS